VRRHRYGWEGAAPIAASSWSEWPHTIFSGQMSSSLEAKTSRTVEAMIHVAMPAAMRGSKIEFKRRRRVAKIKIKEQPHCELLGREE
jgi:hypothetical protein